MGTGGRRDEARTVLERPFPTGARCPKAWPQEGELWGPHWSASLILFSCVASVQVSVYLYGRLVLVIFIYNLDKSFSFLKYIYLS